MSVTVSEMTQLYYFFEFLKRHCRHVAGDKYGLP